jgi:predicted choloylglycine hydrolase
MSHRYIAVTGNAYERGEAIGQNWRAGIITILKSVENATLSKDGMTLHQWLPHAKTFLPFIRDYAPITLEEMKGMAAGCDLPFDDILLLACAYEKWFDYHSPEHCTAFAAMGDASKTSELICGQNNDECLHHWAAGQLDGVIHHHHKAGLEKLIYTHPGIPAYMGMNSAGLCLLWMAIDNGERSEGLPTNVLIREALQYITLESAVNYIKEVPKTVPNSYMLAHAQEGICSIECSPSFFCPVFSNNVLYHANHILDAKMAREDKKKDDPTCSTISRYEAIESLIEKYHGKIDISLARQILSDHTCYPESICAHPRPDAIYSKTLASMVFHPDSGSMEIAFGNGCEVPYKTYSFSRFTSDTILSA